MHITLEHEQPTQRELAIKYLLSANEPNDDRTGEEEETHDGPVKCRQLRCVYLTVEDLIGILVKAADFVAFPREGLDDAYPWNRARQQRADVGIPFP